MSKTYQIFKYHILLIDSVIFLLSFCLL